MLQKTLVSECGDTDGKLWIMLFGFLITILREQSRIVQLILKKIEFDGATGRVTTTFHPDGIKTIAMENRPKLVEAAS
ncbi:MAG: hypothetical protein NTY42_13845 [Planctomycetota bacterium]|nr:hypothetical protein [Planctomycetota bacterium]